MKLSCNSNKWQTKSYEYTKDAKEKDGIDL